MIITIKHIRACKICSYGARNFFNRYKLDWSDFLRNGIEESKLLDTKELWAYKVVDKANGR